MEKIEEINRALEEYFSLNNSGNDIPAKDLMPWFIEKGVFVKDVKNGLPIRKILRELDKKGQLYKIPRAYADRKSKNINWYFLRIKGTVSNSTHKTQPSKSDKRHISKAKQASTRSSNDEAYVIDLCDEALRLKARRQHSFDFLVGDSGKNGQRRKLPVDAYYESLLLVIEYRERQHTEEVRHFDKPDVMTISGVNRGEQRKIYDQRRREELPKHGMKLIEISYTDFDNRRGKIHRSYQNDLRVVKRILSEADIE